MRGQAQAGAEGVRLGPSSLRCRTDTCSLALVNTPDVRQSRSHKQKGAPARHLEETGGHGERPNAEPTACRHRHRHSATHGRRSHPIGGMLLRELHLRSAG